ncbi:hypothetical protein Tco_0078457 [Tanacetum coccineum]
MNPLSFHTLYVLSKRRDIALDPLTVPGFSSSFGEYDAAGILPDAAMYLRLCRTCIAICSLLLALPVTAPPLTTKDITPSETVYILSHCRQPMDASPDSVDTDCPCFEQTPHLAFYGYGINSYNVATGRGKGLLVVNSHGLRAALSHQTSYIVCTLHPYPLEGRSTLRPADILVFGWAGGKHACVDLTGVSPLVGLRDNGFVAGQAALKAESSKVAKHEKACLENQHVFIPFAFDTFGFLAPEAEEFLNRVQRVVQSNFSTPKTQNFIFSRIGFAIQKGVAAQLVARLPAILL